jgi:membrane-anchored glycerophosphoryl diester phosphodiesterase (GDPDase)
MKTKFTVSNVLTTSWKALVSQVWILAGLMIGYIIFSLILSLVLSPMLASSWVGNFLLQLFSIAISLIFSLGYTKNLFQALDGDEPLFSAYGQQARKIGTYFVSNLLAGLASMLVAALFLAPYVCWLVVQFPFFQDFLNSILYQRMPDLSDGQPILYAMLGGIVLCLPAMYISIRFMFTLAFIVDEDTGIIESLRKSWAITKGQALPLFLLGLLSVVVIVVSVLLFFIGLFISVPLICLVYCCLFRELNKVLPAEESLLE